MRQPGKLGAAVAVVLAAACSKVDPVEEVERGAFSIDDAVREDGDTLRVRIHRRDVPLAEMPVAQLLGGLPMAGLADVAIDVAVPLAGGKRELRGATGTIAFGCAAGCTLGDHTARLRTARPEITMPFGQLAFDKIDARIELGDGRARIARWQVESRDVQLELALVAELAPVLADSALDGCLRFKPSEELSARDRKTAAVIALTGAPRGADGMYTIRIGGTIGARKLFGEACTPGAPAGAKPAAGAAAAAPPQAAT